MTCRAATQSSVAPSSFTGRAVASAAVSSSVGTTMPTIFARIHYAKTNHSPRKLTKKCAVPNLTASVSAPLQKQREAASPPYEGSFYEPKLSSHLELITTGPQELFVGSSRTTVFQTDLHAAGSSCLRPHCPKIERPKQVRPVSQASPVQAEHLDNITPRRSVGDSSLSSAYSDRVKLTSTSPSIMAYSSPLHYKPPLAVAVVPSSVKGARSIQQIMGKKYAARLNRLSVLPALSELPEEEQSTILVAPSSTTALPSPPLRPAAPVNFPNSQRSQSQQLKARNDLVEFANELVVETAKVSSRLRDAVSQNVIIANQLEQQKKDSVALEESIQALWSLAQPGSLLKTAQICEQVKLLAIVSKTQPSTLTKTTSDTAALEQKLGQQTQQIAFYKNNDAASRQFSDSLVHENKQMKAQLDKVEAERLRLQTSLRAAESKLERIEHSLYVYPASAQEIFWGAAT